MRFSNPDYIKEKKYERIKRWHSRFVWRPVYINENKEIAVFETVMARYTGNVFDYKYGKRLWEFKSKDAYLKSKVTNGESTNSR